MCALIDVHVAKRKSKAMQLIFFSSASRGETPTGCMHPRKTAIKSVPWHFRCIKDESLYKAEWWETEEKKLQSKWGFRRKVVMYSVIFLTGILLHRQFLGSIEKSLKCWGRNKEESFFLIWTSTIPWELGKTNFHVSSKLNKVVCPWCPVEWQWQLWCDNVMVKLWLV